MTLTWAFIITVIIGTLLIWLTTKIIERTGVLTRHQGNNKYGVPRMRNPPPPPLTKHQYNRLRNFIMVMQKQGVTVKQLHVAFETMKGMEQMNLKTGKNEGTGTEGRWRLFNSPILGMAANGLAMIKRSDPIGLIIGVVVGM